MSLQHRGLGVLVGVDGSPPSNAAVGWAARDAQMRSVALTLVHVVAPIVAANGPWPETLAGPGYSQWQEEQARHVIAEARKVALAATSPEFASQVTSEVFYAPIVPTVVDLSKQADMVVVGCRGQGTVDRALLGSVSSGLVHRAHCPVAVIHDEDARLVARPSGAPVVVGIDGSPTSELATDIAFDEAARRGVGLVALHAWNDMGPLGFASMNWAPIEWRNIKDREEEVLAERLAGWKERYPNVVVQRVVICCDQPAHELLKQTESAQLVVVGSHGRGGFPGMLLGSVSRAIVNSAQIPVIIARVPHDDAGTPGSK
ncbi:MAG: universal stress protein [Actinomycetia bacterium]|nr:universal stress protein [Actinomycetes bacterium]